MIEHDDELGGVLHCQKDNLHVSLAEIFSWLNEVLNYRPVGPAAVMVGAADYRLRPPRQTGRSRKTR